MDEAWLSSFAPRASTFTHKRQISPLDQRNGDLRKVESPRASLDRPVNTPPSADVPSRPASGNGYRSRPSEVRDTRRSSLQKNHEQVPSERQDDYDLILASNDEYSTIIEELELSQHHLDSLLDRTKGALDILSSLSESFRLVEEQTDAFHRQCQDIIADQKRMTAVADGIKENVQYYTYLEPITRRLNAPGPTSIVTRSDFPEMLANLDSCLDYMQGHPKQKEAAMYQAKYKLLLTRSLTLIRVHFTDTLRNLAADVSRRIADKQLNDTTQSALMYARFRAAAPELRELGLEILKRAVPSASAENEGEAEYQSLMNELYQSYSTTRGRLVFPLIVKKLTELSAVDSSDLVTFARTTIGYIRGICLDEYELWREWFMVDGGVYEFLESLCDPLFDHLRPRIIHETKLIKLCELCTMLQTTYADDEDEDGFRSPSNGTRRLNLPALIQPALADAQTRLVFLVMTILRNEIENYKPSSDDLCWPRPESGGKPVLSGQKGGIKAADDDPITESDSWYPTLPKAIRLLSRIYRLVNSAVFDDLAHQIVHSTTESLVAASAMVSARVSPTDSSLFLIIHLLRLKQQIVAFDIEFVTPEVTFDFSNLIETFYELRDRGGLWNPGTWYRMAAGGLLPRVVENMLDAKSELDGRLRTVINQFVEGFVVRIVAPLKEGSLEATRAATAVRGLAEKEVGFLRTKLGQYVDDVRTQETLVAAVRDQVVLEYEDWADALPVGKVSSSNSRKGKGREDEVWTIDMFTEWCERIFAKET